MKLLGGNQHSFINSWAQVSKKVRFLGRAVGVLDDDLNSINAVGNFHTLLSRFLVWLHHEGDEAKKQAETSLALLIVGLMDLAEAKKLNIPRAVLERVDALKEMVSLREHSLAKKVDEEKVEEVKEG